MCVLMKMISINADGYVFTWHGGAYVEIANESSTQAFDVINVYDYEKGAPRIPFTVDALNKEITKWLRENTE